MTSTPTPDAHEDAADEARGRALASPLRLRILRLCLHEPRTNRELADALGVNPGTMLHHVRTLVDTGYLEAQDARSGTRGAREIPYLATGRSWREPGRPGTGTLLVDTFMQEIVEVDPESLEIARLGLRLTAADRDELRTRMHGLLEEFIARSTAQAIDADPPVERDDWSVLVVVHPDVQQRPR